MKNLNDRLAWKIYQARTIKRYIASEVHIEYCIVC
jgi:hypothetical protein